MSRKIYLEGQVFQRLLVLEFVGDRYYMCKCVCGNQKKVRIDHLRTGKIQSCGCLLSEIVKTASITHGQSHNPLYFIWAGMKDRCYREDFEDFHNYGGRGITVCDEWLADVNNFVRDMTPGYRKGLQIDRIDNDGNYEPNNCRWVTRKQNNRNKRTSRFLDVDGVVLTVAEWAEKTGVVYTTILGRINRGLTGKAALYGLRN